MSTRFWVLRLQEMARRSRLGRASEALQMSRQSNCVFFFISYKILLTVLKMSQRRHTQSKQNVCLKKLVPRWVYCLFASSALLHCANIASIRFRRKEHDVLGLLVTLLLVYLFIVIQKFPY